MNARLAQDAAATTEIEVALFEVSHPDLPAPIRLSTDNTERLSEDPYLMGTRSTWRGADPEAEPWLWIIADAILPGDDTEAPAQAQVALVNLDAEMVEVMRSFTSPAEVRMAVVLASSPDLVEQEWSGLLLTSAEMDASEIRLTLSRDEIELEPFPAGRMTRRNFPGLHP